MKKKSNLKNKENSSNPENKLIPSIIQQKKSLRAGIEQYRRSLFSKQNHFNSFQSLLSSSWFLKSKIVALYISQDFEFPTDILFDFCSEKQKKIVVPVIEKNSMVFRHLKDYGKTQANAQKIHEPPFGTIVDSSRIDVFFVPLVAFDWKGARLGRGGGYFDRLFSDKMITGIRVGVGYEFQSVLAVPQETFDIKMDYILTEKQLRRIL